VIRRKLLAAAASLALVALAVALAQPCLAQTPQAKDPKPTAEKVTADTLFRTESFAYKPLSRDPFKPLVVPAGEGTGETDVTSLDVSNISLNGIMWGPSGRLALIKDSQGVGYVLEEGDNLIGGKVVSINDSSVVFEQSEVGQQKVRFAVTVSGKRGKLNIKQ
jgi:hypothetical protein